MRVVIWGAGGHGKVVADVVRACGHEVLGYVDGDEARVGEVAEPGGARVLCSEEDVDEAIDEARWDALVLAVGNNDVRLNAYERFRGRIALPSCIHPSALVSPSAVIGEATVIMPGAVVNAAATIGNAVILNTNCVVEHDCFVGDGVHVSPNATLSGDVRVEARAWIGAGATVIPCRTIGAAAVVGAGATVIRDVEPGTTNVGVPARPIE